VGKSMMDYRFFDDDGAVYTVSTMPTQAIIDILADNACEILDCADVPSVTSRNVIDRLMIELTIRELQL
jgi:hypothetical protein